jgi:hypothetical protein
MEVFLIIIAVNSKNPEDIPGKVSIKLSSIEECLKVKETVDYKLKFKQFIIESKCIESQSSQITLELK